MGDEPDYLLLDRYFAGECTPAEDAALQRWIAERPDRRNWVEDLRAMRRGIHLVPSPAPVVDVNAEWVAFATEAARSGQRDAQDRVGAPSSPHTVPQPWPRGVGGGAGWRWAAIAASILVALGVGLSVGFVRHGSHSARPGHEYVTAAGQRLSVTLVDGTQLTLAPASRLRVATDYATNGGARSREVKLEGEAYFSVAHDAAHPFAVRAHGAVARDVGTAFDVRAYPEDAGARIAVTEGAVAVSRETRQSSGLLSPLSPPFSREARAGDVATVANSEVTVEHKADVAAFTAWREGRLVFEDAPLPEVVRELARWYGASIVIGDSALNAQVYSTTVTGQPVDEVLAVLAASVRARVDRRGKDYVLVTADHVREDR